MLMVGGLIAATVNLNLPTAYRGAAILTILAGGGMALLAGKSRGGDVRFRRAAVALSLTIVVLVGLMAAFGVVHIITLLAIFPLIAGAVLMTRPGATTDEEAQ
jgi:peptidoglycan/LPS O-acetylase OafA/YrhL